MRGGVECGRMPASGPFAGIGGSAMGRRGCGAAIGGRDDAATDDGPATNIAQSRLRDKGQEVLRENEIQRTDFKPALDL
jgi:hypothetical protein